MFGKIHLRMVKSKTSRILTDIININVNLFVTLSRLNYSTDHHKILQHTSIQKKTCDTFQTEKSTDPGAKKHNL